MSNKVMLRLPEVARILNVSEPFVQRLIDEGTLKSHPYIWSDEVFAYKEIQQKRSRAALKRMIELSEEIEGDTEDKSTDRS